MRKETKYKGYSCDALGNIYNKHGKKMKINSLNKVNFKVNGKTFQRSASRIIYEAFKGEIPKGHLVKRMYDNSNSLHNLKIVTRTELNSKFIKPKRCVSQYVDGECVMSFKSARECAKKLYLHPNTVTNICNGVRNYVGYDLRWE